VRVPMLWGFLRPTLLLPAAAVTWPVARLRIVLLHEMAHLGRLDGLALLVGRLAAAVWWFHPLVWFVERRARRDCERACDDVVLNCGERPSSYAGHLLEIAGELPAVTAAPAGSLALTGPGPLETRVMSILHPRTPRGLSPRLALAVLFVAIAGVVSVSSAHLVERAADRPDEPVPRERAEPRTERETLPALRTEARAADEILLAHDDHEEETAGARAFKRAYELHSEESFEEAIAGFEESAAAGYRVGTSLYNAACGYARLGRSADAIATLERSLEEGFDSYDLIFHDSDLDPIRSGAAFRRLLDEIPDPGSTEKQGTVDNYEAAVGMYNKLVADNRVDGEAWYMVGSMLLRLRDLERATDALGRAAEQMGDRNQNALYNLACANSLEGNDRAALDHLERAVLAGFDSHERFRNDSDLDNIRGESRFAEIEQLHDTLSLDRFRRWGGGDSEYSARRWAPAVDEFTEFIHRNPDVGRAWYDLGWSLHFSRRHEEARGAFEKQLELGYRTDIATYNIACTFAMEGRTDEALTWLERAVDTGRVTAHQLLGDEDLESLRDDERFETLLERLPEDEPVHLKHKWKVKTKKMKEKEATLF
jgi:tetratricopeptide (TPR) repeat protein